MSPSGFSGLSTACPMRISSSFRGVIPMARATLWPEGRPKRQPRSRFRCARDDGSWAMMDGNKASGAALLVVLAVLGLLLRGRHRLTQGGEVLQVFGVAAAELSRARRAEHSSERALEERRGPGRHQSARGRRVSQPHLKALFIGRSADPLDLANAFRYVSL